MRISLLINIILMFVSFNLFSQDEKCGVISSQESTDLMFQTIHARNNFSSVSRTPVYVPVVIWDVRTSSGSGGLSQASKDAVINDLNTNYAGANVQFYNCEGPYNIDNSTYYDFSVSEEYFLVNSSNNKSNKLNIYLFNSVTNSSGSALNGYTYLPGTNPLGNNSVFITKSTVANGSTISHEVGHFFSLNHTHGGGSAPLEYVNGSNCTSTGDYICDTEADPNLSNVVNPLNCTYIGFATDPNGQLYNPNPRNIMSYSWRDCRDFFSNTQNNWISYSVQNDYNFTCSPPPPNPVTSLCDDITTIICGQTLTSNTNGQNNSEESYSCNQSTTYNGNEKVFELTLSNNSNVSVSLSNADANLDLFLLNDCDTNICSYFHDSQISVPNLSAGTYYIVVDGKNNYNGGFDITVTCDNSINITTSSFPVNSGSISGGGQYNVGDSVTLVANFDSCWSFVQWYKNGVSIPAPAGTNSTYQFVATTSDNYSANFEQNFNLLSLTPNILSISTETGAGSYLCGSQVTITANVIDNNYEFISWSENSNTISTQASYTFQIMNDVNYVANYQLKSDTNNNPSSINEGDKITTSLNIYPNPSNGKVNISSKEIIERVELYDVTGKKVDYKVYGLNSSNCYIEVLSAKGLYQIVVHTKEYTVVRKLQVN